jgi:hypothetical protein
MLLRVLVVCGLSFAVILAQPPAGGGQGKGGGALKGGGGKGGAKGPAGPGGKQAMPEVPKNYTPPKTPWGEPDLQGIYTTNHLISVGLQRNARWGGRAMKTEEEYTLETTPLPGTTGPAPAPPGATGGRNSPIPVSDRSNMAMRQTSLIVFPEDGTFPTLTPYGQELQAKLKGSYHPSQTYFDSVDDFSNWDRCITRGMPVTMEPRNYNNGYRIVQGPGFVTVIAEMAHEARVFPTTPMPKLDGAIKQYLGEPRGHWEGNTLVVESTNYNGLTQMTSAGAVGSPGPLQPSSPNMRTIEKFTRVSPIQVNYELTYEDPEVLAPGKMVIQYPMYLDNTYDIYEYACHEGNTAVRNYIEASRFERGVGPKK